MGMAHHAASMYVYIRKVPNAGRGRGAKADAGKQQAAQPEMMASSWSSCEPSDSPRLGTMPISVLASAMAGIAGVAGAMVSSRLSRASLCLKMTGAGATAAAAVSSFGEAWGAEASR